MTGLILLTRAYEDSQGLAERLAKEGYRTLIEPMLVLRPLRFLNPEGDYDGVIFTSAHGVKFFGLAMPVPAYCVGSETAAAARAGGFKKIISAEGDAADLVNILSKAPPSRLLYIRGAHTAREISFELEPMGHIVEERVVYAADPAADFTPDGLEALKNGSIEAALFFSRRTAENFVALADKNDCLQTLQGIKLLAISHAVLKAVRPEDWAGAYAAAAPNREDLVRLLRQTCPAR